MEAKDEEGIIVGQEFKLKKPRRVRGTVRSDGCILPAHRPNLNPQGGFRRPAGRQPLGFEWNTTQGLWAPLNQHSSHVARQPDRSSVHTKTSHVARQPDGSSVHTKTSADANLQDSSRRHETAPSIHLDESSSKRKAVPKKPPPKHGTTGLDPRSLWQEPEREDNLTLYERHRKPRPVHRGRVKRPLNLIEEAFRCVICLGRIQNTRMVVECLHRFCEECIERSMRVGRNQCPICRVVIPSRRSLAPDPDFDRLILSILGEQTVPVDVDQGSETTTTNSETLQRAIFRKQMGKVGVPVSDDAAEERARSGFEEDLEEVSDSHVIEPVLVDVALFRDKDELELDELELPYLRLKESATVDLLKRFLQAKLNRTNTNLQIISYVRRDKPVILTDWIALSVVASDLSDSSEDMVHLYYRIEPPRAQTTPASVSVKPT